MAHSIIVGGSNGIGRFLAEWHAARGDDVVITSRDAGRAAAAAADIGPNVTGIAVDLADPHGIATAVEPIGAVDSLVVTVMEQGANTLAGFDIDLAVRSVTTKLVGYPELVRALLPRMSTGVSVVLFGGLAKDRHYPGSTMVTTFNGGVSALVTTLANELAPRRVDALHPGVVGDSPRWRDVPHHSHADRAPGHHGGDCRRHRLPPVEHRRQRPEPLQRQGPARLVSRRHGGTPDVLRYPSPTGRSVFPAGPASSVRGGNA
jgi:NAD(P)-dependent dehydrogenase (short-subunit alcohol dehydrogenase family)